MMGYITISLMVLSHHIQFSAFAIGFQRIKHISPQVNWKVLFFVIDRYIHSYNSFSKVKI